MRTHVLLILVIAILVTSGCSARRGTWWPFSGDQQQVASSDHQAEQWTGAETDFPQQASPPPKTGLAFLNPFNWRRADQFEYEGEVIDLNGCRGCGAEGNFPGNGQCNNCLRETVNDALGLQGANGVIEAAGQPLESMAPVNPTTSASSGIPAAPTMNQYAPGKVVKPHPALTDHVNAPHDKSAWQRQQFKPVQPELVGNSSTRSDAKVEDMTPQVPTTMMQDQRMNKYQSPIPNWDGLDGKQENSKPARVVNQFEDDVDWSKVPRSKSIAMPSTQKTGGEPVVQVKSNGTKSGVIEINPDQPRDVFHPVPQEDPKFEQFSLDDLFPADMQPPSSDQAKQQQVKTEPDSAQLEPTPIQPEPPADEPAKSIMENDNIDWGLPNQLEPSANESSKKMATESHEKQYSLIDESEVDDDQSAWGEGKVDEERSETDEERSEFDRDKFDEENVEDESLYEDEHGVYDEDTDFSQNGTSGLSNEKLSTRSEKDIIEELRNSTVPNRIVFDNTPQIPAQRAEPPAKPMVLSAKPVPHYQELRQLAQMNEDGVVDMSNEELMIEKLPDVRKTPALPVSSQRVIREVEEFDFQPLPNLMLPTPIGLDDFEMDELGNQAFDPDFILNATAPEMEHPHAANPTNVPVRMVDGTPKRSAVPVILKAAPTFVESDDGSDVDSTERSNARIRFIKPSFQRELND